MEHMEIETGDREKETETEMEAAPDPPGAETEKWFVVQTMAGMEEEACRLCEGRIPKTVLRRCYIPYYQTKRKVRGEWKVLQKPLFPGYLILVSGDLKGLAVWMKSKGLSMKLLRSGEEITPLTEEERLLLLRLGGDRQVMEMSEGTITGSMVQVCRGPLKGMEGSIRKVDRHKRKAWVELPMFGGKQLVEVGLEIVKKI